jgi:hypothetical protein
MNRFENNIFLDLDSTCIYSLDYNTTELSYINSLKSHGLTVKNMENMFWVVERPGLQPFLDFLFSNFNVSVWTAATKDYALWIIDEYIAPPNSDRQLEFILWSEHCELCQDKYQAETSKDLSVFWRIFGLDDNFSVKNTLILDDNCVRVWDRQECNCLLIKGFEADEPNCWQDNELPRTRDHLQNFLDGNHPEYCPVGDGMYTDPHEMKQVYAGIEVESLAGTNSVIVTEVGSEQGLDDFSPVEPWDIPRIDDTESVITFTTESEITPDDSISNV